MRYFIHFSYDGTAYHGWQVQPGALTVQECLQQALSTLMRRPIEVVGAGRTDAGVHASHMVAHLDLEERLTDEDLRQLAYRLNKILPRDIAVQRIEPVAEDMHARFSATARTYHYFVHLHKDPFRRSYSWQLYGNIDFERMNEAAATLKNYEDFTSFSKVNTDTKTNLCRVYYARWEELSPGVWRFEIKANRFLRNMVRAIVGTLMEVGRGRMTVDDFRRVIEQKDRCLAGESVPGNALFLVEVAY